MHSAFGVRCGAPHLLSEYLCRAACVWTAVRSVYGRTAKKQKRKYISGIDVETAGQILVVIIFCGLLEENNVILLLF